MAVIMGVALGMMVGGLVVVWLSSTVTQPLLKTLFYWVGIIVACCGLFLILAPIVVYISGHLTAALGVNRGS